MQAVDQEVLTRVRDWLEAGTDCHLCTIVRTYGSSPRPVGSLLACSADGELVGSLSGGCVEDDLVEQLRNGTLAPDGPRLLEYGLAPEDTEKLGLPCGGHLHVVAEPVVASDHNRALYAEIVEHLAARRCVARSIDLAPGALARNEPVAAHAPLTLEPGTDGGERLVQVYGPRHHLFLIGAGMVSRYLAEMAAALNFEVTVCDPREAMIEHWSMPGVRMLCAMPDDAVREHADDERTAIIALTHDPRIDDMGLMEALSTRAFYVGAMGSSRTSEKRRQRLRSLDLDDAEIDRLHAPVGLPIGSHTPPEIAVAILAELTQILNRTNASATRAASGT